MHRLILICILISLPISFLFQSLSFLELQSGEVTCYPISAESDPINLVPPFFQRTSACTHKHVTRSNSPFLSKESRRGDHT
ncbi:hypothetical protein BC939DRAFT_463746 [Gamsiella multidivaricata]|uniref:uncharacterized protein n=1 Tax=Gamsiella multidivaricata TaxID=101098 RepID=UPI002220FA86|nr:uncharacterized protein BC939DRAFT_463746 [Gamsiella multidivaricata]KAI7818250.1 hypothetical protein BC939DRAFT_463746 [Gamsiella multidivaricata]